ncbi:N-acetylmuramoyl-L-alanine amidase [Heyndrickxia sporothermodurans]|uniref:N-acetylmuramoyl-L-alanine amidase n=1 Tax=Heyndrickxia sporothermodurans TaxID=46224 RepID=UPI002E2048F6
MLKIMLDAGHGPNTPGKRSPDNYKEFSFTSSVADHAKALLETYENVSVYFAHSKKEDVPLKERTDKANRLKVDCYVAIHANAYGTTWTSANGIETYVYLTKPKEAVALANKVQKNLIIATGLADRGVKTADFHVLRETNMTAILTECGFYTNKSELKLIRSESYQKTCAEAIVKGIVDQYKLKKKKATTPPKKEAKPKELYKVQIGAFADEKNEERLLKELKDKGYDPVIVKDK